MEPAPGFKARTTLVIAVAGGVGTGKSTLATRIAHANRDKVAGWVAEAGERGLEGRGAATYTWHWLHDGQRQTFAVRANQGYEFNLGLVANAKAWLETLDPGKPLDLLVTDEFGRAEAAGGGWAPCIGAILRAEPRVWLICVKDGMHDELEAALGRRVDAVIRADDPEAEERFRQLVAERKDWETVGVWGATSGGIEMSLGSALHAGLVPMRGLVLSTMQAVLLTRASGLLGRRDRVVWVSFIAGGMKALSPAGNRLRPMMAITIQGLLYRMAVRTLGWSRLGATVGGAFAGMWAVSQGILLNLLFLGGDLTRAFDEAMKWFGRHLGVQTPSFWAAVIVWVALWGFVAGAVTAWAYGRPAVGERWLSSKHPVGGVASGGKPTVLSVLTGALRDLVRPTFWLPVLIVAAILTGTGRPWEGTMWMTLRAATIAFALFVAVRWLDPVGLADWLRKQGHWGPAVAFGRALEGLQRIRR